jgi:hypothetical protein
MAVNLARSCPRCRNYFGVVIAEPKTVGSHNPSMVVVLSADTKSTRRYFQVIAESAVDKISPGPKLDALTAEKVFGWKKVHKHNGALLGRKQDKAGRWRRTKVPNYSTNPLHSYSVENRMQQLGRMDRYQKELSKITRSKNIPSDWASPDQRCRAAIKAVGRYGEVIPLSRGRKQIQK